MSLPSMVTMRLLTIFNEGVDGIAKWPPNSGGALGFDVCANKLIYKVILRLTERIHSRQNQQNKTRQNRAEQSRAERRGVTV